MRPSQQRSGKPAATGMQVHEPMRLTRLPLAALHQVWLQLGLCARRSLRATSRELRDAADSTLVDGLTVMVSSRSEAAGRPTGSSSSDAFDSTPGAQPVLQDEAPANEWLQLCSMVQRLSSLRFLNVTLLPGSTGADDILHYLGCLGSSVAPGLQHLHLDIRCAELSPALVATVACCFPNILYLELYGLGCEPRTSTTTGGTPPPSTSASSCSWIRALSLLPAQLTHLYLASIDQDGWFRRCFISDQDLQGLTQLLSLRELKITGITSSQPGAPINVSVLQPLVTAGSLTHITIGTVPLYLVDLDSLTSWHVNPRPRNVNTISCSALGTFSGGCHVTGRPYLDSKGFSTLDTSCGSSSSKGAYLGIAAGPSQLRMAHSLGWPGFWASLRTLWLRGMSGGFMLEDIAALGTLPALRELFMSSCFQKGRLSELPAGCLTQLTTLKLWWTTSSDLAPGELAGLLQGGALSPHCRLLLTSGPCIERARQCPLLAADCRALAAHPGGWSTQLTSRKVLCEFKGLILFYERCLGSSLAEALAPLLPSMDGLVVSSPSADTASSLLAADWLSHVTASGLTLLGAQCNDFNMLNTLLKAVQIQVQRPGCKVNKVIARIWGSHTIANLSSPAALAAFQTLLSVAPPDLAIKVCVEEGGLVEATKARDVIQRHLRDNGCDADAVQVLVW